MPTISQLPTVAAVTAADLVPISQAGATGATSIGELLASTQPAIILPSPALLGRTSLGSGDPEAITVGAGLSLSSGVLSAEVIDPSAFPTATTLSADANVLVLEQGASMLLPASALRSLFAAGQNVTISPAGTISAAATATSGTAAPTSLGFGSAIAQLTVVSGLSAQDLVPASHAGLDCAVTYASLVNGITIDQAQPAVATGDADTLWVAQGGNVMASQTFSAIWAWIAGKLPTYKIPVVEISTSTNLDTTVHNDRLLICSQPLTLTPLATNMGSGFSCTVLNASSGNVTLGSGFISSTGSLSLLPWQSASLLCASYSGGLIVYATMPGTATTTVTAPGQVTTMTSTATTSSTISLTWQAPASGTAPSSYTIQYRLSGTSAWTVAPSISGSTSYQITGLQPATSYDIVITASAAGVSGTTSAVLTVSTAAVAQTLVVPTIANLAASPTSSSSIQLSWSNTGGAATSFTVQYRVTGTSTWTMLAGITGTSALVQSLQASTSYDLAVFGINAAGTGSISGIVTVTTPAAPQSVSSISWNLVPSGTYTHGSGAIGVNANVSPASSAIQFGFSTSAITPPTSWTPAVLVNTNLWGVYVATPSAAGTWYVWAEGLDGSALTVHATPFTVQ